MSNCPSTGLPIEQAPCKIIFDFDIPEKINNIIDFPKRYRENTGFNISPDEMKRVNTPQVIKIEEEK